MNRFNNLAFALFGNHVRNNREHYSGTGMAIRQSHITLPWDIYVGTAYLYAVITGILCAAAGYLFLPVWLPLYQDMVNAMPGSLVSEVRFSGMGDYGGKVFLLTLVLFFSLLAGLVCYCGILAYPRMRSNLRRGKIDMTLPHAVAYMHALSKGGLSLILIFKSLSHHINIYGEAAEEIAYIVMDTELHGRDLISAMKNAAVMTQSMKFRDFLENLINVAETSGDLETFFGGMAHHYHNSAEADQSLYLETLGMLAETYITVFVAGPLFLITILIVMGIMGPESVRIFKLLIYAVIPLSSVFFIVLLSMVTLRNDSRLIKVYSTSKRMNHYDDVRTTFTKGDERLVRNLMRSLRWTGIFEVRKNPFKPLFSDPFKSLYITVPAAMIYFILSLYQQKMTIDIIDDAIIISTLILLVPFLFFYEMQSKRIRMIEDSVPGFLRRLAIINDVGMPIAGAIKSISKISVGVLSTEAKLMYKDLVWSNSILDALIKFERRVRTVSISRIVTLITKASESTGNIKETLRVAANNAALTERLRRQKFTVLFSYLIVVYLSFFVFLLVLYLFTTIFLPQIPASSPASAASSMFSIGAQRDEFARLFMHATVIQGFFSGIIAGQMMGENVYDGLKHSVIMMGTAYLFFAWFV